MILRDVYRTSYLNNRVVNKASRFWNFSVFIIISEECSKLRIGIIVSLIAIFIYLKNTVQILLCCWPKNNDNRQSTVEVSEFLTYRIPNFKSCRGLFKLSPSLKRKSFILVYSSGIKSSGS